MKNNLEHIFRTLRKEALTADEKMLLKTTLGRMANKQLYKEQRSFSVSYVFVYIKKHIAPTVAGVLILVFGATSVAAEGSLPGDILYPIKISVNENIGDALAVSSKAQAEWDVRVAERRIEEAVALVSQGELTAEVQEEIKEQFEKHVKKADALFVRIADDGNVDDAVRGRTNVEAKLKAHSELLVEASQIIDENDNDISDILDSVGSHVTTAMEAREKEESKILTQKKDILKESVEEKLKFAEKKIKTVQKIIDQNKNQKEGSDSVSVKTSEKFQSAQNSFELGKKAFEQEDYDVAFSELQKSIGAAQETETYIDGLDAIRFNNRSSRNKKENKEQEYEDEEDLLLENVDESVDLDVVSTTTLRLDQESSKDRDKDEEDFLKEDD